MAMLRKRTNDDDIVELFDAQFEPLVRGVQLMVDRREEAEEIVQEAFTRLLTSRRRVRQLDNAPAYLRTVAFNLARDGLRRRGTVRRKQTVMETEAVLATGDFSNETPENSAVAAEGSSELMVALRALPGRQRECLVLRHYMSLSEAEIAETLNISKGSVKTHTSRGLAALQQALVGDPR